MELGRIDKVEIRSQWSNEEYDFTPWLAKEANIQVLSDEIGLDIEVDDTEETTPGSDLPNSQKLLRKVQINRC